MTHPDPILAAFAAGALTLGFLAVGLFFLKFWRRTGDSLFLTFAVAGFALAVAAIVGAAVKWGPAAVAAYYFLPYLVVNMNLVLITFLQHTDVFVPHYREAEFDWLRGALSTVDRSFGWLLDATFHHIADTHVVHHLFHEMPFYHEQEATLAVRAALGDYYLCDHTPIPRALWRSWSQCRFVEDEGGVVFAQGVRAFNDVLRKKGKKAL
jgi:omega-6 fatty acid desaturase (delta-12 desaturase)